MAPAMGQPVTVSLSPLWNPLGFRRPGLLSCAEALGGVGETREGAPCQGTSILVASQHSHATASVSWFLQAQNL